MKGVGPSLRADAEDHHRLIGATVMKRMSVVVLLALASLALLAVPALALTPASDGAGRDYGRHHAGMAQAGELGKDMNPGHHRGMSGWEMPMP